MKRFDKNRAIDVCKFEQAIFGILFSQLETVFYDGHFRFPNPSESQFTLSTVFQPSNTANSEKLFNIKILNNSRIIQQNLLNSRASADIRIEMKNLNNTHRFFICQEIAPDFEEVFPVLLQATNKLFLKRKPSSFTWCQKGPFLYRRNKTNGNSLFSVLVYKTVKSLTVSAYGA